MWNEAQWSLLKWSGISAACHYLSGDLSPLRQVGEINQQIERPQSLLKKGPPLLNSQTRLCLQGGETREDFPEQDDLAINGPKRAPPLGVTWTLGQ